MKRRTLPEMRKEAQEPLRVDQDSGNLDEAIKLVYMQYGTDLSAFFRDAYKAARKHQKTVDNNKPEKCP